MVADAAVDIATTTGLESISMSKLAQATGASASGILTVFPDREAVQVATVERAVDIFIREVITPAWTQPAGAVRLGHIVDNWFDYLRREVFPGGCFLVATSVEYGARTGPVAEAVHAMKRSWVELLEAELRATARTTEPSDADVRRRAFELEAFMTAANIRYRMDRDADEVALAQQACRDAISAWAAG